MFRERMTVEKQRTVNKSGSKPMLVPFPQTFEPGFRCRIYRTGISVEMPVDYALTDSFQRIVPKPLRIDYEPRVGKSDRYDILADSPMEQKVGMPVSPLHNNIIDESAVDLPLSEKRIIQALNRGMRLIQNYSSISFAHNLYICPQI